MEDTLFGRVPLLLSTVTTTWGIHAQLVEVTFVNFEITSHHNLHTNAIPGLKCSCADPEEERATIIDLSVDSLHTRLYQMNVPLSAEPFTFMSLDDYKTSWSRVRSSWRWTRTLSCVELWLTVGGKRVLVGVGQKFKLWL